MYRHEISCAGIMFNKQVFVCRQCSGCLARKIREIRHPVIYNLLYPDHQFKQYMLNRCLDMLKETTTMRCMDVLCEWLRLICTCLAIDICIVHFLSLQAFLHDAERVIHGFPESGTEAMLDLETTTNDGMNGRYCFKVDTAGVVDTCAGVCV